MFIRRNRGYQGRMFGTLGVRRSSVGGPPPLAPTFGTLAHQWDASDTVNVILNRGAIGEWKSSRSPFLSLTQATLSRRPLLVNYVQNNRPVVRFDGVNDYMAITSFAGLAQPFTIVMAISSMDNSLLSADGNFYRDNGGLGPVFYLSHGAGDVPSMFAGGTLSLAAYTSSAQVYFNVYNGASSTLQGATTVTGDAGAAGIPADDFNVGGGLSGGVVMKFDLCEMLIYNTNLSAQNIVDVKAYMLAKWGIA